MPLVDVKRIAIGLALLMLVSCIPMAGAEENNSTVVLNTTAGDSGSTATSIKTVIQTIATIISPAPAPVTEKINPPGTSVSYSGAPGISARNLTPAVQRKISTNLLYLINSNAPQTGLNRDIILNQMQTEGKLKMVSPAPASGSPGLRSVTTSVQATNIVLVYIDLVPTAPTSIVDSYVSSVTERNEQDHSVVAWVDINNLDSLASLDAVSNVRTAEPSVTKDTPVYQDTKFVNSRAGLPPLTADEAKASVREFEKVPGMVLEQKRTMQTPRGEVYEMASDSSRYFVNAKTGEVELASFYGKQKNSGPLSFLSKNTGVSTLSGLGPITMDQAFVIAQDYAGKNYKNFNSRTMVLSESKLVDHDAGGKTYYFKWCEKIDDVIISNFIFISINADDGSIQGYVGIEQPFILDIVPTISKEKAKQIGMNYFSLSNVKNTDAFLSVFQNDQYGQILVWVVNVGRASDDQLSNGGQVIVDAHTGNTIKTDPFKW